MSFPHKASVIRGYTAAVLAELRDAAARGLPAPRNAAIAAQVGLGTAVRVAYVLQCASRDGLVTVEYRGPRARVFAAADGSWRTAPPKGWDAKTRPAAKAARAPSGDGIRDPDAALAAAKVHRMWDDCVLPLVTRPSDASSVTVKERAAALSFCTAPFGPWAKERDYWCSLAGIDPDVLRERALRRQDAGGAAAPTHSAVAHVAAEGRAAALAAPAMGVSSRNLAGRGDQPRPAAFSGGRAA